MQWATRTFRIDAGVLRLRPTNRGTPSVNTAATAGMSPLRNADKASGWEPPALEDLTEKGAARAAAEEHILARRMLVTVAGGDGDAFDAERFSVAEVNRRLRSHRSSHRRRPVAED